MPCQDTPQDTLDILQDTPQDIPATLHTPTLVDIMEAIQEDLLEDIQEVTLEDILEDILEEILEDIPEDIMEVILILATLLPMEGIMDISVVFFNNWIIILVTNLKYKCFIQTVHYLFLI